MRYASFHGGRLRRELASMCSEAANSILRQQSSDAICEFSWGKLHDELEARAPIFLSLIEMCTHTRKPRCNRMEKASLQQNGSCRNVCSAAFETSLCKDVSCTESGVLTSIWSNK